MSALLSLVTRASSASTRESTVVETGGPAAVVAAGGSSTRIHNAACAAASTSKRRDAKPEETLRRRTRRCGFTGWDAGGRRDACRWRDWGSWPGCAGRHGVRATVFGGTAAIGFVGESGGGGGAEPAPASRALGGPRTLGQPGARGAVRRSPSASAVPAAAGGRARSLQQCQHGVLRRLRGTKTKDSARAMPL